MQRRSRTPSRRPASSTTGCRSASHIRSCAQRSTPASAPPAAPPRISAQAACSGTQLLLGGSDGPWAARALRDAARRARRRGAPDAAARYLQGALTAGGEDPEVLVELA